MSFAYPDLRQLAKKLGVSQRYLVSTLISIYTLDRLDLLLEVVKREYSLGLTPTQRVQLSAFVAAVAEILKA